MAPDDSSSSGPRPAPVVLRIKLRYDDIDTMVARFAPNVGRLGLFLPTKSIQPVGAEVKFELRLATDAPAVIGLGRVKATRAPDPANPRLPSGMTVELLRVTRDSRDVIMRMLERRRELGLLDLALPMPSDVDSARRVDSEPSVVRAAVDIASGPIVAAPPPVSAPPLVEPPPIAVPAIPTPPPGTVMAPLAGSTSGDALLTAPRVLGAARDYGVKPLAPEPMKRPRPRISELIARSTGSIAAQPALDDNAEVDVASAMARARALATGDLDDELDALSKDRSAAPVEISIEAASAELARQLGGSAVRRIARDAVAEGTAERPTVPSEPTRTPRTSEPPYPKASDQSSSDRIVIRTPEVPTKGHTQPLPRMMPAKLSSIAPLPEMPAPPAEPPPPPQDDSPDIEPSTEALVAASSPLAPHVEHEPLPAEPHFLVDRAAPEPELEPEPADEPDDDDPAEWDSAASTTASTELPSALLELQARSKAAAAAKVAELRRHARPETPNPPYLRASTEDIVGAVDALDDAPVFAAVPDVAPEVAEPEAVPESLRTSSSSIDVAIDDAIDAAILRTPSPDEDPVPIATATAAAEPITGSVIQLDDIDMEDIEHTNVGDAPQADLSSDLDDAEREAVADIQAAIAAGNEFEIEEVSDFEILAEADAADADLLLADGERDAGPDEDAGAQSGYSQPLYLDQSQSGVFVEPEPPLRPSQDFASRLDLGDDDEHDDGDHDDHGDHDDDGDHPPAEDNAGTQISGTPSSGYAPSAYDDHHSERHAAYDDDEPLDFDRPSERYRYATRSASVTARPPAEEFDEPHAGFGQPRYESSPSDLDEPGVGESSADADLEATLSALHADLDDLSLPHAKPIKPSPAIRSPSGQISTLRSAPVSAPTPPEDSPTASGRAHRRASTEDGILIDFDDDDDDE